MPPLKQNRDPFEVELAATDTDELAQRLAREIQYAVDARERIVGRDQDIDTWHALYEGGSRSLTKNTPWPGAANLTSFIPAEKVDALRSKIVETIFTEPIWIVEGWGDAAIRAPFVEEYHQWKAEEERLQSYVARAMHNALVEGTGVLEVSERSTYRKVRMKTNVQLQVDPETNLMVLDENGNPVPATDPETGDLLPPNPALPSARVVLDKLLPVRCGAQYRVLSLRDFFILPGHAADRADVWGYAKRVYLSMAELKQRQKEGFYKNVTDILATNEREASSSEVTRGQDVPPQIDDRAEKEIWEITFLDDLDDDGYREWYVATIHVLTRTILRLQYDDLSAPRYCLFTPFPRSDSLYGFSLVGHKLGTITDEHTAWRNMVADRSALVTAAPVKRVIGSPWEPDLQPFGPRQVIDVRDPNEVTPFQMNDVPSSAMTMMQMILSAAERVSGLNDITLGVNPAQDRTLGENQLVAQQSFGRINEAIRNCQEGMEDLFLVRHEILKRALEERGYEPLPEGVLVALETRGFSVPTYTVTPDMLAGTFRGKPRGSVETADPNRQRADFVQFMTALTQLSQAVPGLAMHLQRPEVMRSILTQIVHVYRFYDRQAFLGSPASFMAGFGRQDAAGLDSASAPPPQAALPPGPGAPGGAAPAGAGGNPLMELIGRTLGQGQPAAA